jgi:hypothetical protein
MNSTSGDYHLSARQRTIPKTRHRIKRITTLWGLVVSIFILVSSCHEKTNEQNSAEPKKETSSTTQDSLNKPKTSVRVNRHYDDKGNLVGFDSTYSSYYSNITGDTSKMDSLMLSFDRYFNRNHSLFFDNQLDRLFFNDSTSRYPDFFHKDYFLKRYELNDAYLRGMMNRMDSIKNRFYLDPKTKRDPNDL